jgi:hypothetical protein
LRISDLEEILTEAERVEFPVTQQTQHGREDQTENAALDQTFEHVETGLHMNCL